jgi:hypothetical protein
MPPVNNFFAFKFTGPDDWGWTRRPSFVTVNWRYRWVHTGSIRLSFTL